MPIDFDAQNYEASRARTGYVKRADANTETYSRLGFKSGLEIHQQLLTDKKLFCRCPAGVYHRLDDFDAEVIRHMRPTLSELGEYDGTALMEFRTRKNIVYHLKNETACTYEIDDTPPFPINRQALDIAIEIALMLKTNVVGELHIIRKQYLDGSIPTGFQRTAIIGIEGEIPLSEKNIRIIQLSIEEDSCREVSDIGHWRTYSTDRLGIPLIEMVTYPEMLTPDEAEEAGHYLRYLARSCSKVRTGIGAGRQDVNVSIEGGVRVEIKGVQHIRWIPELTHNEAFRQKALLLIRGILKKRISDVSNWQEKVVDIDFGQLANSVIPDTADIQNHRVVVINLPGFHGLLSHFTQHGGKTFANELSDRLKVIACLERQNLLVSETVNPQWAIAPSDLKQLQTKLGSKPEDAQIVVWGNEADIKTAIETIRERCQLAFEGVPDETRKSLKDGTTLFERVLPGPDRMYPDTDSAPIPIADDHIEGIRAGLAPEVRTRMNQLREWNVPLDCFEYILVRNLVPLMERIVADCDLKPSFVGTLLGHRLKNYEGTLSGSPEFSYDQLYDLAVYAREQNLDSLILPPMLKELYQHPKMVFESILTTIGFKRTTLDDLMSSVVELSAKFDEIRTSSVAGARWAWIMGRLRPRALGSISLTDLSTRLRKEA